MMLVGGWQRLTQETRFLGRKKKPGFYDVCWWVARVDARNPVSGPKEETGFLWRGRWGGRHFSKKPGFWAASRNPVSGPLQETRFLGL